MVYILLLIILILSILLFSPNVVYFIHKSHFMWKNKVKELALEFYYRGECNGSDCINKWIKGEPEDWLKDEYNL